MIQQLANFLDTVHPTKPLTVRGRANLAHLRNMRRSPSVGRQLIAS